MSLVVPPRVQVRMARLTELWFQLKPLHAMHYAEAEPYDRNFRPDYPGYFTLDHFDHLPLAAAFVADQAGPERVVGYLMCVISQDLHHQDQQVANEAGVYLLPDHRNLANLRALYDVMERYLRDVGVRTVYMTSREVAGGARLGAFLRRRAYQPLAEIWVKQLHEE